MFHTLVSLLSSLPVPSSVAVRVNVFVQTDICRQFTVDLGSESVLIMTHVLTAIFCIAVVRVGGDPKLFKNNPSHRIGFPIRNGKQSVDIIQYKTI